MPAISGLVAPFHQSTLIFGTYQWRNNNISTRYEIWVYIACFFGNCLALWPQCEQKTQRLRIFGDRHNHNRHPSIVAGQVGPFEAGVGKGDFMARLEDQGPEDGDLLPLTKELVATKAAVALACWP